jgi:hypothetical protein
LTIYSSFRVVNHFHSRKRTYVFSGFCSQDRIRTCTMRCVFLSGLLLLIHPSWLPTLVTNLRIPIRNLTIKKVLNCPCIKPGGPLSFTYIWCHLYPSPLWLEFASP